MIFPLNPDSANGEYLIYYRDWILYRDIMRGGIYFTRKYVQRFRHESGSELEDRVSMTPCAGFSRAAIVDVRNSIFQRMDTIRRNGGSTNYQKAVAGHLGGVNLRGNTMNYFMGMKVLTELLFMGKVGIYVDSPRVDIPREQRTLRDTAGLHPYIYTYVAEDILDWKWYLKDNQRKLQYLKLRVIQEGQDALRSSFSSSTTVDEYREFTVDDDGVHLRITDGDNEKQILWEGLLEIPEIPFILLEMESPLLTDIAYHQIALTNLESADVNYAYRSNTIMYVEEYDPLGLDNNLNSGVMEEALDADAIRGEDPSRGGDNPEVVKMGSTDGKRIAKGLQYPQFINPSSEPLKASREKQADLKHDIRALINLAVTNAQARHASAESKEMDNEGLQAGLAAIGFMLEQAEREAGRLWHSYEPGDPVDIHYPTRYSLRSDKDRREDAAAILDMSSSVPSKTFRTKSYIEAAVTLFAAKISDESLDTIVRELEGSEWPTANPDQIKGDVEVGLVSRAGASAARGYPKGEADKAKSEQKERDAEQMKQQFNASARGVSDDSRGAKLEKQNSQSPANNTTGTRKVRGNDSTKRKARK